MSILDELVRIESHAGKVMPKSAQIFIAEESARRTKQHEGNPCQHKDSPNYERVGLTGEVTWALLLGYPLPEFLAKGKDGGKDFFDSGCGIIDIKTANTPTYLRVETERFKMATDIYVQARYMGDDRYCEFVGWATREEVLTYKPYIYRTRKGIDLREAHNVPRIELHSMYELYELLEQARWCRKDD